MVRASFFAGVLVQCVSQTVGGSYVSLQYEVNIFMQVLIFGHLIGFIDFLAVPAGFFAQGRSIKRIRIYEYLDFDDNWVRSQYFCY